MAILFELQVECLFRIFQGLKMSQNAAFHQDLHFLFRQIRSSEVEGKKYNIFNL